MRNLINLMEDQGVTDAWFRDGGFETCKRKLRVPFTTAETPGTIDTLEGPVKYQAGYKIITGLHGEQYPIPPEKFDSLYDDNQDGTATPKMIVKMAKLADHNGFVTTSWGEKLNYTAGNDYIVRHGPGDYGVVKKDIFAHGYHL